MKRRCLSVVFAGLCFLKMAHAEGPGRFHLDLNRPPPRAGEETERTIQVFSTASNTNPAKPRGSTTHRSYFFELKGREKILSWDVSNDLSKVELTVLRLVGASGHQTNELARPGTQLIGTSILGESFFVLKHGTLPMPALQQLKRFYNIRPRHFDEFAHIQLPSFLSIGQTYKIPPPPDVMRALENPAMSGLLGAGFTNEVRATGELVGTTNLFGFNCFHLQIRLAYSGMPGFLQKIFAAGPPTKIKFHIALTVDLFVPSDPSQRILREDYWMRVSSTGSRGGRGKAGEFARGQSTLRIVSVSRPLSPP